MLWKVRKGEGIEDFVRERGDDGWLCQVFNGSLDVKLAIVGSIPHSLKHTLNSNLSKFHKPSMNNLYFSGR